MKNYPLYLNQIEVSFIERIISFGSILESNNIFKFPRAALRWMPQWKRKQATWRRICEKEIKAMGLTWGEAEMRVEASCSLRS